MAPELETFIILNRRHCSEQTQRIRITNSSHPDPSSAFTPGLPYQEWVWVPVILEAAGGGGLGRQAMSSAGHTEFDRPSVLSSVQFSHSVVSDCDPMNRSMPGLPVHHQLPQFTQTHVHRVSDAIQPSHPLSSPSPPAPNPSQHQSLFQ